MTVTIHNLAVFRGIEPDSDGNFNPGAYARLGLPFAGSCEHCSMSIVATDAYPSTTGKLRCLDCIGALGYETVEEANADIFGPDDFDLAVTRAIDMVKNHFPNAEVVE